MCVTSRQLHNNFKQRQKWIDDVVLIGSQTHARPWVRYEIKKAFEDGKGLLAIHIHNLKCPNTGTCAMGPSPFTGITFTRGKQVIVPAVYTPDPKDAYGDIARNLSAWVERAIAQ